MKVKELREILTNYSDEMDIFLYNDMGECDGLLDKVEQNVAIKEEFEGEMFFYSPHGCNADSEAQEYWSHKGPDTPVLFLISNNIFHNFNK